MKPVIVVYATREGHTRHIAERVAARVQAHGFAVETVDALQIPPGFSLDRYGAAIIAASVHSGSHEVEIVEFVKTCVKRLNRMTTAFLSVSLSEAGVEDERASLERRRKAAADVTGMINAFLKTTGWIPGRTQPVAGALMFTRYNFLLRFVMKRISNRAGGDTDTSRDYTYTNWKELDEFVDEFTKAIPVEERVLAATDTRG